jgi:hypothetical protein
MRLIALVAVALAGTSSTSTFADAGKWCGTFRLGSTSCGYSSSEECMATVRGLGGFCYPNPFPGTAYGTSAGSWNPPRLPTPLSARLLARSSAHGANGCVEERPPHLLRYGMICMLFGFAGPRGL